MGALLAIEDHYGDGQGHNDGTDHHYHCNYIVESHLQYQFITGSEQCAIKQLSLTEAAAEADTIGEQQAEADAVEEQQLKQMQSQLRQTQRHYRTRLLIGQSTGGAPDSHRRGEGGETTDA